MVSDDHHRPKRRATATQDAYLRNRRKLTKHWRTLWRTKPTHMEDARRKATLAASLKVQEANRWLTDTIKGWPDTFTPADLLTLSKDLPYVRKGRKRRMPHASLVRRLRSMGLIHYNPSKGLWVNLSKFSPYAGLESQHSPDRATQAASQTQADAKAIKADEVIGGRPASETVQGVSQALAEDAGQGGCSTWLS